MIKESYVSFKTAKLLKDKGFQQIQDNCGYFTTDMVYSITADKEGKHHFAKQYPAGAYNKDKYIAAPTQQMVMRWLREVHKICIVVYPFTHRERGTYTSDICTTTMTMEEGHLRGVWDTYEDAVEVSIEYCLTNLI